jgi:SAM-dependent methyltransferase
MGQASGGNTDEAEAEAARIARIYAAYRASARKRSAWAADNPGNVAIRAELLDRIWQLAGPRLGGEGAILDLGCGAGHWLEALARGGVAERRLHGIDLIERRASQAARRVPGATVEHGDGAALPHPDGAFELVLALTVLSSLSAARARRVLAEVRRVLRPGGLALVYEPRAPNPANRETRLVRRAELERAIDPEQSVALTLLPPLARRLGRLTPRLYPALAACPALRTHRLTSLRRGEA